MKKWFKTALGLGLVVAFMASCSSTPPPTPTPPPPAAPPPAASVAPTDSIARVPEPEAEMKQAESLKQTIETYNLSFAKPEEFRKGNEGLSAAKEQYGKDNAKAKQLLDGVIASYNIVIESGLAEGGKARRIEMETAKKKADEIMAARSAPDQYRLGQAKQAEAEKYVVEKKYQEAWESSGVSIAAYNQSYTIAAEKRGRADASLRMTDRDQAATDTRLQEVEKELNTPPTEEARP